LLWNNDFNYSFKGDDEVNFIKRALYSVTRKKGKSLILFAVIFVLGNVIAGAIAIQQSTQNVEKNVKKQLGGLATIEIDYENNQDLLEQEDFVPEQLKVELIKKIGKSPYLKYYDYNTMSWVQTKDLKAVTMNSEDSENFVGTEGFSLKGTNYSKILDIEEKKIKLVSGSTFTQEEIDSGKNVGLISKKVADENGLSVGDQMIMDSRGLDYTENGEKELFKTDIPIKIIGIFEPMSVEVKDEKDKKKPTTDQQFLSMEQLNTVYLPNKAVVEINKNYSEQMKKTASDSSMYEGYEDEEYYTPVYVLKNPDDVEAFKQETQPLLPEAYKVIASTDQYDKIGGSMNKMAKISGYVVWIAVIAALLIISLVVLLFMRDRKHELGIYLSLGDKRGHVMGQIILELLLISGIALILSLITGNFLGKIVSESLLNSDFLATAGGQMDNFLINGGILNNADLTTDDILNAYEVKFSIAYIISYLVVGLATVLLSAVLPLLYIVRLNPKKIMM
jgi:putative ABC transport system permease protein